MLLVPSLAGDTVLGYIDGALVVTTTTSDTLVGGVCLPEYGQLSVRAQIGVSTITVRWQLVAVR